jgi:hypothetical protein
VTKKQDCCRLHGPSISCNVNAPVSISIAIPADIQTWIAALDTVVIVLIMEICGASIAVGTWCAAETKVGGLVRTVAGYPFQG